MLYGVGVHGFSWSSSILSSAGLGYRAYYLGFLADGLDPNATAYRSHGLQTRCLQE
ncbi:MAG: hypothetical protein K2G93_03235 [Rikenella sp.]|nr:hypothetical protein [Rikenella sp.]